MGLLVGMASWAAALAGAWAWGPLVAAALVLVADLLLTGGLHRDGLADVADGVASRRQGDALREVLADPRVGGIGAATLGVALVVRVAVIALTIAAGRSGLLVLVPVVGRAGMVLALTILPQTATSLTSLFARQARGVAVAVSLVVLAFGVLVVEAIAGNPLRLGVAGALGVVAATGVSAMWQRYGFSSGGAVRTSGLVAELVALLCLAAG